MCHPYFRINNLYIHFNWFKGLGEIFFLLNSGFWRHDFQTRSCGYRSIQGGGGEGRQFITFPPLSEVRSTPAAGQPWRLYEIQCDIEKERERAGVVLKICLLWRHSAFLVTVRYSDHTRTYSLVWLRVKHSLLVYSVAAVPLQEAAVESLTSCQRRALNASKR